MSVWRASLEDKASGSLLVRALAVWSFEAVAKRPFKQRSARVSRWVSMGLLVNHGRLLLGLRCNARDSCLFPEGLKRGGLELSGDDAESSVLAAFQLVQPGWGQPGLPGWGSVVDNTEIKESHDGLLLLGSLAFFTVRLREARVLVFA